MTLPFHPNPIRMQGADSISGEFGGPGTDLTQYYAGGAYVPGGTIGYPYGIATPIPTSGTISLSNFHGAKREYLLTFYDDAQWVVPAGVTRCDTVIVAGGGGGGSTHPSSIEGGGGGGAGGVVYEQNVSLTPGTVMDIRVGNGGYSFGSWRAIFPHSRVRDNLTWQETNLAGAVIGPVNPDWAYPTGEFRSYYIPRGNSEDVNSWGQAMQLEFHNSSAAFKRLNVYYRGTLVGAVTFMPNSSNWVNLLIHQLVRLDNIAGHNAYYELQQGQNSSFGGLVAIGGGVGGGYAEWFGENSTNMNNTNPYIGSISVKAGGWGGSGGGGYGWHGWVAGGGSVYGQGTNGGEGIEESWAMSGGGGGAGSAGTGYGPGGGRSFNLAGTYIEVGGGGAGGGWGPYSGGWGGGGQGAARWGRGGEGVAYTGGGGGGGGADGGGGGSGGKGIVYVLVR